MVRLQAPAFVMTVVMILIAPTHQFQELLPGFNRALHCPRTAVALMAREMARESLLVGTSADDCEVNLSRPWTVRCAPYCGSDMQQQIYAVVVIDDSCGNITRVAINTTAFSAETYVNRLQVRNIRLMMLCGSTYRPFLSGLFVIPGNFCGPNAMDLPNITVELFDRCGSQNLCCREEDVRVVRFMEV
ncbi:uncharacterized protein [Haliotis asinina]|uniref:uncharacterized protein n=1 Tax=Haliotis asinina TaxID=109174 RepID=UPI003531D094